EIQCHVSPIVAFLRIELMNRHQFHDRYPQLLQIGDLLDQTGISSTDRVSDIAGAAGRESLYVKFVDDSVREMQRRFVLAPAKFRLVESKNAERCATRICSRAHGCLAPECGRKKHSLGVRIE